MMKMIFITLSLFILGFNDLYLYFFFYFLIFIFLIFNYCLCDFFCMIGYMMGVDYLSWFMVILSVWVCGLMIISFNLSGLDKFDFFIIILNFLIFFLFMSFLSMNFFVFFIFFEASIIPTLVLILAWGYQSERVQAGVYMCLYMILFSLPMLISLFFLNFCVGTLDFYIFTELSNIFMCFYMFMVFLVKIPMYMVHLWLPKAHLEAPVFGSMILAGVMLKLGGYGLMRLVKLFLFMGVWFDFVFIILSLIGGIYVSLICIQQVDLKSLIAYCSISHMGMALGGILSLNSLGYLGCLIMMVGHGLSSSGLFCLLNLVYERFNSRSVFILKGVGLFSSFSFMWLIFCLSNMSFPPLLNFFGELFLIMGLISLDYLLGGFIFLLIFLSCAYSLYLFNLIECGSFYFNLFSYSMFNVREFSLIFLHLFPLFGLSFFLDFFF